METNQEIFIQSIKINEVRHLHDVEIALHPEKRTHLILTGKNGSGKTSVLEMLKDVLDYNICHLGYQLKNNFIQGINEIDGQIKKIKADVLEKPKNPYMIEEEILEKTLPLYTDRAKIESSLSNINYHSISLSNEMLSLENFYQSKFILSYIDSKRTTNNQNTKNIFREPKGIEIIIFKNKYNMWESVGFEFLQYIVNLKADRSFAKDDNDTTVVEALDAWFSRFENSLKLIFGDESLVLEFDRKTYNFYVTQQNRPKVTFNELSDGYASILRIVSELMMRMEASEQKDYNTQGIVLIDEIEAHLHIDLQKKILPFLTSLFPRLQFIVTTHSPFVLSSLDNAVVFDLEKKIRVENLSAYSVEGIIEGYFDNDKYSNLIKMQVSRYETLLQKALPTEDEKLELYEIKQILERVPLELAPELVAKFSELELNSLLQ